MALQQRFTGDYAKAASMHMLGKYALSELKRQMSFQKLAVGRSSVRLEDGIVISCRVIGSQDIITIHTPIDVPTIISKVLVEHEVRYYIIFYQVTIVDPSARGKDYYYLDENGYKLFTTWSNRHPEYSSLAEIELDFVSSILPDMHLYNIKSVDILIDMVALRGIDDVIFSIGGHISWRAALEDEWEEVGTAVVLFGVYYWDTVEYKNYYCTSLLEEDSINWFSGDDVKWYSGAMLVDLSITETGSISAKNYWKAATSFRASAAGAYHVVHFITEAAELAELVAALYT